MNMIAGAFNHRIIEAGDRIDGDRIDGDAFSSSRKWVQECSVGLLRVKCDKL